MKKQLKVPISNKYISMFLSFPSHPFFTHIPYPLFFLSDPFTDFFFFLLPEIPGSHDNNANPLDGHGSVMDSGLVL